ncbi:molybdopterin synthase subunit MoaD [Duganella sp. CF458]|uniref:MoaD/ThiS family protein n=1 Tax=Duganella sp. CF458 TaxID=1884368 RepID=UPI0008E28A74|nr:MoaD/ThiS family protein [Duganella sp. CF458]SFF70014.1 molybdopterin synthase subunit MoaD [Duganella sp. CF458]
MAQIIFTQQLARFLPVPTLETRAATLRAALEGAFADNPRLGPYVLDEQGRLRANVAVFIDGKRSELDAPLGNDSKIYVLQALSGG